MKTSMIISGALLLLTFAAHSAESKKNQAQPAAETKDYASSFRCEKFGGSLGDLKMKMIETCDLERPFSTSMTRVVVGEETYMFCCHKAK